MMRRRSEGNLRLGYLLKEILMRLLPPTSWSDMVGTYNYFRFKRLWRPDRVAAFKNVHQGQTIYVCGAGPSLNQTNLESLKGQPVIFVNAAYKLVNKVEPAAAYWVIASGQEMNRAKDVDRSPFSASFKCTGAWGDIIEKGSISEEDVLLRVPVRRGVFRVRDYCPRNFSDDIGEFIFHGGGGTVIFMGIQIAAYLGASRIVLLGVDLGVAPGSAVHHFDGSEGLSWVGGPAKPKVYDSLASYARHLAGRNISLVNGSAWTTETVLPKVRL